MLRKIAFWLIGFGLLWLAGLGWFAAQIPQGKSDSPHADAIVILTGGKGRVDHGLALLAEGKAEKLFISGVGGPASRQELLQRLPAETRDKISEGAVMLGYGAENTIGNAEETAGWVKANHITSVLLVTSNYHMPRSLSEFREKMPPDVAIVPAPVFSGNESKFLLSEYHKYLAGKLRHWIIFFSRAKS